jgi:hypothetical protein
MISNVTHNARRVTTYSGFFNPYDGGIFVSNKLMEGLTKAVSDLRMMLNKKIVIARGIRTKMPDIIRARRCLLKADRLLVSGSEFIISVALLEDSV